jgi:hypothetical protein
VTQALVLLVFVALGAWAAINFHADARAAL